MITETSSILSLFFAKGLGAKTLSNLVDRLVQEDVAVDEFAGLSADVLVDRFGLRRNVADGIHSAQEQAERVARELDERGIQILIRGIPPYPPKLIEVLAENAPPLLFAGGNLAILDRKAVGFSGARNASKKGIRVAGDAARLLAASEVNVVSGYAALLDVPTSCPRCASDFPCKALDPAQAVRDEWKRLAQPAAH